jgi:hypothetical protein
LEEILSKQKTIPLAPTPENLLESLRDIGYSMETAVADIIDNSITAQANSIEVRFAWNDGNPWIAIIDDGHGMDKDELIEAMRFGSISPKQKRSSTDLGRFGLGMKTASISQCRRFTVISKKKKAVNVCEWDLDYLAKSGNDKWLLKILTQKEISGRDKLSSITDKYLQANKSGTIVFWDEMDRIDEKDKSKSREISFDSQVDMTREHVEEVFHRFISPPRGQKGIKFSFNKTPLKGRDPFNQKNTATQELPDQSFVIDGSKISVHPFVLPHHNKVSSAEYKKYGGDGGYLHNQGFYIYRNKRLIIKGSWFRLIKKEELNKLIRVRVDIPNTLDHLWGIDVKKSHATPPKRVKEKLKQIIDRIAEKGRRVYRQRGTQLASRIQTPAWNRRVSGGDIIYEINQSHPLLSSLLDKLDTEKQATLKGVFIMLESSFPADLYFNDFASSPEQILKPELSHDQLKEIFEEVKHIIPEDLSAEEKENWLLKIEPFPHFPELTKSFVKEYCDG